VWHRRETRRLNDKIGPTNVIQEAPMFKISTIFFCLSIILAGVGTSYAGDDTMQTIVIKSFEPIVEKITKFFSRNPKLLTKVSSPENPKQEAFFITHFQMEKISYDILTSKSIITPYTGHIDVDTQVADNKPCGNQGFTKTEKEGWSNIDDAIRNANTASCFVIRTHQVGIVRHRFIFQYHVKTGRWALSEIVYQDGSINGRFMALLGVPSPWFPLMNEPLALSYDKDWIQLFKSL
jgi:hypothetical protein